MDLLSELDAEDKVILFCEFKPTVAALKELCEQAGLGCVTLVGNDSLTKRQKAIDRFQQGSRLPGVHLHHGGRRDGQQPHCGELRVFLGLPWTPGQQEQAEDRAYRNGQLRMVVVKIPLVEGTIDEQLWQLLNAKRQVAQDLIEPEQVDGNRALLAASLAEEVSQDKRIYPPTEYFPLQHDRARSKLVHNDTTVQQETPQNEIRAALTDYRLQKNMVLQALLKIEALYELAQAASPELLANIKEALSEPDRFCEMATAIALYYLHREPTVPALYVELVEDEIARYPFTYDEIESVMDSKSERHC